PARRGGWSATWLRSGWPVGWLAVIKITSRGRSASLGTVGADARAGRQPKVYLSGGTFAGRRAGTRVPPARPGKLITPSGDAGHRWTRGGVGRRWLRPVPR